MLMQTATPIETLGDLLDRLGRIDPERVRFHPAPGTATEADVVEIERKELHHAVRAAHESESPRLRGTTKALRIESSAPAQ
jgi:hypothetical protein